MKLVTCVCVLYLVGTVAANGRALVNKSNTNVLLYLTYTYDISECTYQDAWFLNLFLLDRLKERNKFVSVAYYESENNTAWSQNFLSFDLMEVNCNTEMIQYYIRANYTQASFKRTMALNDYMQSCLNQVRNLNITTYIPEKIINMSDVLPLFAPYPGPDEGRFVTTLKVYEMYKETYYAYHSNYKSLTAHVTSLLTDCFAPQVARFLSKIKESVDTEYRQLWFVYIYMIYLEKALDIIIFITGILMNGLLIFLFIKYKEMRTEKNLIIFNLSICDLLTISYLLLLLLYPVQKDRHWSSYAKRVLESLSPTSTGTTILVLSVQRFRALQNHMNKTDSLETSPACRILLYLLALWVVPILRLILNFRFEIFHLDRYLIRTTLNSEILYYIVLANDLIFATAVPIVVTVLNTISSRRLRRFAKNIPGEGNHSALERSRSKSSTIIICLAVIFWVTHTPVFSCLVYIRAVGMPPVTCYCVEYQLLASILAIFYKLFYLNATLNPLTLFIMSRKYRQLLSSSLQCLWFWKRES